MLGVLKKKIILLMVLALTIGLLAVGCTNGAGVSKPVNGPGNGENPSSDQPAQSVQGQKQNDTAKEKVLLYFSDDQALFLIPEEREILKTDNKNELLKKVAEELVKGPTQKNLSLTMPQGVKVNSTKLEKDLVTVDFSKELQTNHWGGSAGEMMTVYSIVNTLTQFPEVTQVQILIDGQKVDSISGHLDISQPLIRDNTIIKE